MIRFARTPRLVTSGRPSHFGPAAAAGLILWLAAAPAGAGYVGFPNQPGYANPTAEPPRAAKPRREAARPKHETARETPPPQGPFQIVVDIAKQQVALYGQDGFITRAGISTGMPGHPTPLGVFTVISKAKWHQSNIYSGAPMPYMQRITLPTEAIERISALVLPGSSLIVSDNALSDETDADTDFIVLTP